jgi:uracil-DNA glycosylase
VILGQDPYHQPGQATGRAFEVPDGVAAPPSLRNILKLLAKDLGRESSHPGLLAHWESEGVLLLNTVLTVSKGEPESHRNQGWEVITDRLIEAVAQSSTQTVFFLWGAQAQKKANLIEGEQNLVLTAPHPSPLSAYRGFFDAQQFSRANQWLSLRGQPPINWLGD